MKYKLLFALLFIFSLKSFSQDSKLSLEASYPIPSGDNFISKNYKGIVDIGAKYRFVQKSIFNLGASINGDVLVNNTNKNKGIQDFVVRAYLIQSRVFTDMKIESIPMLHPFVGVGYTFIIFKGTGTNNGLDLSNEESIKQNGFNANLGIAYDISSTLFATVQYDYIKLNVQNNVPNTPYNTNVNLLKIGIGVRL